MELNLYNNSKKIMKTKLKFLSLFLILAIAFVACRPDDPDDGGDLPAPDARLNYQGIWKCSEIGGQAYNVNISLDTTTESQIKLYNFHNRALIKGKCCSSRNIVEYIPSNYVSRDY